MSKLTERILFLKFVGILKFVKIRNFRNFFKFIKFESSIDAQDNAHLFQRFYSISKNEIHGLSQTVFGIIPWPICGASTSALKTSCVTAPYKCTITYLLISFTLYLVSSSSPTPTPFHHYFVITCTKCVFSFFSNKNIQQSWNSDNIHHFSQTT